MVQIFSERSFTLREIPAARFSVNPSIFSRFRFPLRSSAFLPNVFCCGGRPVEIVSCFFVGSKFSSFLSRSNLIFSFRPILPHFAVFCSTCSVLMVFTYLTYYNAAGMLYYQRQQLNMGSVITWVSWLGNIAVDDTIWSNCAIKAIMCAQPLFPPSLRCLLLVVFRRTNISCVPCYYARCLWHRFDHFQVADQADASKRTNGPVIVLTAVMDG